jgi:hypothetical protein
VEDRRQGSPLPDHLDDFVTEDDKTRNRIERSFNKLKNFRRFATRYDRHAIHFMASVHIASAMIWMR